MTRHLLILAARYAMAVVVGWAVVCGGVTVCHAQVTRYPVRLDFEDLGDETVLATQYLSYGIEFEGVGTDGNDGFISTMVAPFGNVIWTIAPPIGLTEVLVGPDQFDFAQNERYVNFQQAASRVTVLVNSTFGALLEFRGMVKAWDGPGGTGTELFSQILPAVILEPITIDTGTFNIQSITFQAIGNTFAFDELTFDSGTAPKGGNLVFSSSLDGIDSPQVFIDGNPAYAGNPNGVSPKTLLSIATGKHTVSMYTPGYEWHQEIVDVALGQDTLVHANFKAVVAPTFSTITPLATTGGPIDAGDRSSPYPVDWDADGLLDLVVGNAVGDVDVYLNTSSNESPLYASPVNLLSGVGTNAAPVVVDFYEDGRNDIVVGYADGTVQVSVDPGSEPFCMDCDPFDPTLVTVPGGDAVPLIVDFDNDGRKDLLAGSSDGNVYLYLNQRLDASPDFSGVTPTIVATVSGNAAPSAVLDWDGDGNKDLLVGEADGSLNLFLNEGTDSSPLYSSSTKLMLADMTTVDVGDYSRPVVGDFNFDQVKDVLVGNALGEVFLLGPQPGDFDFDGDVDGEDFLLWQRDPSVGSLSAWEANYGTAAPISAVTATVPEPTTCTLALAALCLAMSRRRAF